MTASVSFPNEACVLGSSAYYVIRFSKPDIQDQLAAVFLWKQQLYQLNNLSDAGVARLKLQWWQQQLACDEPSAHPLVNALQQMSAQQSGISALLSDMVAASERLLQRRPFSDAELLWQYFLDFGGSFAVLLELIAGNKAMDAARQHGAWINQVESLRNLGLEIRHGICCLPQTLLQQYGLDNSSVLHADQHDKLARLLQQQLDFAGHKLSRLQLSKNTPLYRYFRLRQALLKQLRADNYAVISQRTSLTPLAKLWRAWW